MRASWSWLLLLAACSEHGSPADAEVRRDCGGAVAPVSGCVPEGVLSSDRQMVDFGSIAVSTTSPLTTIQISNSGQGETGSITPVIFGTDAAEFAVTNGCSTLSPGGTCVMTVKLTPMSAGAKMATLDVSSAPGGTVLIALTGVGASP